MSNNQISGDGPFTKLCEKYFEAHLPCERALLTTSCTHALEMAALLVDIQPGDEVIMPSFTFVSTANAFALRGAKIVFVDIRPDTMNIDEKLIEQAITEKTKAIVPVHYAAVACDMDAIMSLANHHDLYVIEDAAQAINSTYKGKPLGTIGHLGTFSFHETKNITSAGEGGLLIVNDPRFTDQAEIIREKGTNRSLFFRGMVDKYSWVNIGSSYLLNDISAAYLWAQLNAIEPIICDRLNAWHAYQKQLRHLAAANLIELPVIPEPCTHNGHIFYIKVENLKVRTALLAHFKAQDILAVFHYIPLHNSKAGLMYSKKEMKDIYTTRESERLIRLPLYYGITQTDINTVVSAIESFYDFAQ